MNKNPEEYYTHNEWMAKLQELRATLKPEKFAQTNYKGASNRELLPKLKAGMKLDLTAWALTGRHDWMKKEVLVDYISNPQTITEVNEHGIKLGKLALAAQYSLASFITQSCLDELFPEPKVVIPATALDINFTPPALTEEEKLFIIKELEPYFDGFNISEDEEKEILRTIHSSEIKLNDGSVIYTRQFSPPHQGMKGFVMWSRCERRQRDNHLYYRGKPVTVEVK